MFQLDERKVILTFLVVSIIVGAIGVTFDLVPGDRHPFEVFYVSILLFWWRAIVAALLVAIPTTIGYELARLNKKNKKVGIVLGALIGVPASIFYLYSKLF